MRAEIIKYPMGALTAEGALIYDENVSGKRPAFIDGAELDGHD